MTERLNELRDTVGGRDLERLEMHVEAKIELTHR
jgi:hypothetical protein